jgi:D-arginine dehydrogenase
MKRSVFTLPIPDDTPAIPMVNAADEEFYFKPDAGQLLCSPADETPVDVGARGAEQPDEYEIARAAAALDDATVLDTRYIHASWAGLRCFADDRTPLVGWDRYVPRLFWHTALGGYGIQTSPALSRVGAALLRGGADAASVTPDLAEALSPARVSA